MSKKEFSKKTVVIAGVGGLGSNVATLLTRMNIGKLILIDFDKVQKANLNRQNYYKRHIGMKKVKACKEVLESIGHDTEIEIHDKKLTEKNMERFLSKGDIIVEAFDKANEKAKLTNFVLNNLADKYLVGASGIGGFLSNNLIKTKRIKDKYYLIGDSKSGIDLGMYGPRVNIAASQQANTVLRIIRKELKV
ncbi:MAG: sulfur carrier protein ThiS adenylyltransferase ThiF [Bacillota bacterium]